MAEHIERSKEMSRDGNVLHSSEVINDRDTDLEKDHNQNVAVRVIWYIAGVLLVLLAFRFVFVLLGANPANGFANFIYTTSHPFVSPFFGIFNYNLRYGVSRFETYTLVAMVVYALIAYGIAKLITINQSDSQT
jgi:hypothetical protein